jgi:hypothetical protein
MKRFSKAKFSIGIISSLFGATLMFLVSVFGETTINIAIILEIVGVSLIATQRKTPALKGDN